MLKWQQLKCQQLLAVLTFMYAHFELTMKKVLYCHVAREALYPMDLVALHFSKTAYGIFEQLLVKQV